MGTGEPLPSFFVADGRLYKVGQSRDDSLYKKAAPWGDTEALLNALAEQTGWFTIPHLAEAAGTSKTSAQVVLGALQKLGVIGNPKRGKYELLVSAGEGAIEEWARDLIWWDDWSLGERLHGRTPVDNPGHHPLFQDGLPRRAGRPEEEVDMALKEREASTMGRFLAYDEAHLGSSYLIEYGSGEAYEVEVDAEYEVDAEDENDPDWWWAVAFRVVHMIEGGPRHPMKDWLIEMTYLDFPKRIVAEDGTVVYQSR